MKNDSINSKAQELVIKLIDYSQEISLSCFKTASTDNGMIIFHELYNILMRYSIDYLTITFHCPSSSLFNDYEDISHNAIMKMLTYLESFDSEKASFITWYTNILHNEAKTYFKKNRFFYNYISLNQPTGNEDDCQTLGETMPSSYVDPETDLIDSEITQEIINAINSLPPRQAEVIYLELFEGLKPKEITLRTGKPIEEIYSDLKLSKKKLRKILEHRMGR